MCPTLDFGFAAHGSTPRWESFLIEQCDGEMHSGVPGSPAFLMRCNPARDVVRPTGVDRAIRTAQKIDKCRASH